MAEHVKPANEAPSTEEPSSPPTLSAGAGGGGGGGGGQYRIKCTHKVGGTFAGWLDYSGPGNHMFLTGTENVPGGMVFEDYRNDGGYYLNPVGTYVGNPRYAGANGVTGGECQADWNYWARRTAIFWDGAGQIQMNDNRAQHLYDYGDGWVYWGARDDSALNCERVSA